jgi:hypothetical protein
MKTLTGMLLISTVFILAACGSAPAVPTAAPVEPTATAMPTEAPTETAESFPIGHKPDYQVIYDFQELHCQAHWTNSGQDLPCPSDIYEDNLSGSVSIANESDMENLVLVGDSALLTYPAHDGSFRGIFGAYPPITLQESDQFRATIGCLGATAAGDQCDVEFSLEYYDEQGNYVSSDKTGWRWNETNDGAVHEIMVPFIGYGGRTLRLVLVVRDNGDSTDDLALWLHPQLWRVVTPSN